MVTTSETRDLSRSNYATGLQWFLIVMLLLGIAFRFIHLDRKVYWHDEVYTSMRAAGYMRQDLDQALFQNQLIPAPALQKFQQIKPGSTVADTLQSLKLEDPQHPPLYFVTARFWMQQFGSSMTASRLLPVLFSLLGLPLMYGLAKALFESRSTALLATTLLALSPFDVLFAQTARQYSLLTTMVIGSSWLLLRAMRGASWQRWLGYGLSVAIGLYTHPFFALTMLAHAAYTLVLAWVEVSQKPWIDRLKAMVSDRRIWAFGIASLLGLLLYGPWIQVLLQHHERAIATTDWTKFSPGLVYLIKLWILSFTSLFFDLDFGFDNPITFLLRLPFLILIIAAFYFVYRRTAPSTHLLILLSAAIPFLTLATADLCFGGKRSAVSRYLISCYPAIQLAVAYFLQTKLAIGKVWARGILLLCLVSSILSCGVSAIAETWWNKDLSYFNAEVIHTVNAVADRSPILLSDMGDDFTNTGDLVALSYGLDARVRLFPVSNPPDFSPLPNSADCFVFRPSAALKGAIAQQGWQLQPESEKARLWRLQFDK